MPALIAGVAAEPAKYHAHLFEAARADGLFDGSESGLQPGAPEAPPSAQEIWRSLLGDYPDHSQIVHAVGCVGLHLAALSRGAGRLPNLAKPDIDGDAASTSDGY